MPIRSMLYNFTVDTLWIRLEAYIRKVGACALIFIIVQKLQRPEKINRFRE